METFFLHILKQFERCLNRTMQYGNFEEIKKKSREYEGLNRTMQYGNSLCRDKKVTKNRGLNRTMQYGNLIFLDFLR